MEQAQHTEASINAAREKYRPIAERGSLLFFLMTSLRKMHDFYQFSLGCFVDVFARSIDLGTFDNDPPSPRWTHGSSCLINVGQRLFISMSNPNVSDGEGIDRVSSLPGQQQGALESISSRVSDAAKLARDLELEARRSSAAGCVAVHMTHL